jgi:uncharacterized alpha-E superfamily protein
MLSRVANSLYWLSRHLERAENLARLVDVNLHDSLELSGIDSRRDAELWGPLITATSLEEAHLLACRENPKNKDFSWFITFSQEHQDSILRCIAQARENARMVRDQISEDMWLELNSFHLFIKSDAAIVLWENQPEAFYRRTIKSCMLFAGLINATILRDEGWLFIQAGKFLERADKTTRILDMVAYQGDPGQPKLATALRSCSGFSAFRKEHRGEISLGDVVNFLLFSESFPRSVRFCLRELDQQLHTISGAPLGTYANEGERLAGNLVAKLNFSSVENVWSEGLHHYLDELQRGLNEIGQQIFETYVLLPLEVRNMVVQNSWQQQQQQQQ